MIPGGHTHPRAKLASQSGHRAAQWQPPSLPCQHHAGTSVTTTTPALAWAVGLLIGVALSFPAEMKNRFLAGGLQFPGSQA
jgi:hypothetical protein